MPELPIEVRHKLGLVKCEAFGVPITYVPSDEGLLRWDPASRVVEVRQGELVASIILPDWMCLAFVKE